MTWICLSSRSASRHDRKEPSGPDAAESDPDSGIRIHQTSKEYHADFKILQLRQNEPLMRSSDYNMEDKNMTAIVALIGVVTLGLLAGKTVSSYTYEAVGANA